MCSFYTCSTGAALRYNPLFNPAREPCIIIAMPNNVIFDRPLRLEPQYRDYVWGGRRLRPQIPGKTAEAWVIYEEDRVISGTYAGKTLGELYRAYPAALLGEQAAQHSRFPLLIKLLDCAEWLSLQVHPNDEQARRLEGPEHNGKTEAWHVLHAEPGSGILCGFRPGTNTAAIQSALESGAILEHVEHLDLSDGDTVLIRAGTAHALGPGLMVYEVQQTSDITYRVYDWDRPPSAARPLHIQQSLQVIDLEARSHVVPRPALEPGEMVTLAQSDYFRLRLLAAGPVPTEMDTGRRSFHALTALDGRLRVQGVGWEEILGEWQSLLIPAQMGHYSAQADARTLCLCSSLP